MKKSWIRKGKLSKFSKEFCRIHFYTGSTHFCMVCAQQILLDWCIRNCSGEKKGFLILRKVTIISDFGYEEHYPKNQPPKPKTLWIDPDIQHHECYSDASHRVLLFPIKLHCCWQGGSVHHLHKSFGSSLGRHVQYYLPHSISLQNYKDSRNALVLIPTPGA